MNDFQLEEARKKYAVKPELLSDDEADAIEGDWMIANALIEKGMDKDNKAILKTHRYIGKLLADRKARVPTSTHI